VPLAHRSLTSQKAHDFIDDGRKILQEWSRRWGTGASFSHRASNAVLGIGLEVPADRAREEILDIIIKGREVISHLESIFVDDEIRNIWSEGIRVVEEISERVTRAGSAFEPHRCATCGNK
jgi:hypothetical protein